MSDIFVSYSSKDRERAALVARALQARGWNVWWDRTIPPGRQYDDVIEEALAEARCVVVLWSKASAASTWVRNEASEAVSKKALIPAIIEDDVKIPFEFRRVQAADLSRWQGDPTVPEFLQFCDAIAGEIEDASSESATPARPPFHAPPTHAAGPVGPGAAAPPLPPPGGEALRAASKPASGKKPYIIGGIVVLVLLGLASMFGEQQQQQHAPDLSTMPMGAGGGPPMAANGGIHAHLVWHDYVLAYSGNVSWDGSSNTAAIFASVVDSATGRPIGNRQLQAAVTPNGPGQIVMSTSVAVPGDSRTPEPHSHNVNLVFQAQGNGGWTFLRNCMAPNDCY